MSSDEKHMNGAPEGELYDVTVLKDNELKELHGTDEIASSLMQAANGYTIILMGGSIFCIVEENDSSEETREHS